jgi:hypothetical protein
MQLARSSDEEFMAVVAAEGTRAAMERFGYGSTIAVRNRVRRIESRISVGAPHQTHPSRHEMKVQDGVVLVGSDAHYWPKLPVSVAHRALLALARELNPAAVILNGDVLDAPTVSVHPAIGWEKRPALSEELAAAQERLAEIEEVAPESALVWTLGNHDMRFETYLARAAAQYANIKGIHLKDHFSKRWIPCWSVWINGEVVVKHRWKGGAGASRTNTIMSGMSMVTGHLHSLNIHAFSDYRGVRWGVDTGTLAVPYGPQFVGYTEDAPVDWRSGFAVLTFANGRLLWPEPVHVINEEKGLYTFRGAIRHV